MDWESEVPQKQERTLPEGPKQDELCKPQRKQSKNRP